MKGNLARKTSSVCFFCALRCSGEFQSTRLATFTQIRTYRATTSSNKPAGAAVQFKPEDDDDDFPLFKKHADTWKSTEPAFRRTPHSSTPVATSEARSPPGQKRDDAISWNRGPQRGHEGAGNRGSYSPARFGRANGEQTERVPRNARGRRNEGYLGSNGAEGQDTSRFQIRKVQHESINASQPRETSSYRFKIRREVDDQVKSRREEDSPPDRHFTDSRVRDFNTADTTISTGFRSVLLQDNNEVLPETSSHGRQHRNDYGMPKSGNTAFEPMGSPALQENSPRAPKERLRTKQPEPQAAEPVSDLNEKMARRSNRFELEIDEPIMNSPARTQSRKSRGSRPQSANLDFEMMEAEASLYGGSRKKNKKKRPEKKVAESSKTQLLIPDFMSVENLAQAMKIKTDDLLRRLDEEGFEGARYDHILDAETSGMFADIYGFEPVMSGPGPIDDLVARPPPEDVSVLPPRPPIVTIMGHVDHGKTTILDWLRKSSVVAGEHGGITQHIGAFSVTMPGTERNITFLDTPGHAAFLDMRKRGANVTDIVVLVVAADDSVKPQTIEAIKHALEAKVQIIVAINKVDKEDANVDRVKQDLTRHEIVVEDYGGDYQAIPLSGKTGQGMEQLEEAIITLADVSDFRAEQDGPAEGRIIESKVTLAGRVATVLIRRGTLRPGDFIVAGTTWGRVRTLRDDTGKIVDHALPGMPVQVDGWRGEDPTAGLEVLQADNEEHAKNVIDLRLEAAEIARTSNELAAMNVNKTQDAEARERARAQVLAWEAEQGLKHKRKRQENEGWVESNTSSGPKRVHFVVKADVAGSVEAIVAAVSAIGNHEITANVVHSGTGVLTESDIRMLATTGEEAFAISFNQPIDGSIHRLAEAAGLGVLNHNIIYKVTDDVRDKLSAALPPLITQRVLGEAEIGQIFEITVKKKKVKIAGCRISNGNINRASKIRVLRGGEVIYTGMLESLKNVKKDVTEMRKGTECGMAFNDWEDFQEGDQIQTFEEKEEKRTFY